MASPPTFHGDFLAAATCKRKIYSIFGQNALSIEDDMSIVEEIKEKINIVDVVSETESVKLRRNGASWVGFCPFHHNTKTPSLVVWEGTQTWKCFGACNDGGSVFDWVLRENPGWDFKEAMRYLAGKANVELASPAAAGGAGLAERLAEQVRDDALRVAHRVFARWLVGVKERGGKVVEAGDADAMAYAMDRGWTEQTIRSAQLGFSGRATAAEYDEMRGEFQMRGIDPLSPEAVMVLGFRGDVTKWASEHGLGAEGLSGDYIYGLMQTPGLVYAHKEHGKVEYFSVRFLPGFDETRKSHNPNSVLAGARRPYFNWLHRSHHRDGQRRGKRIFVVEGQGCAVTWGQFGEAAMALCGASWNHLENTGVIQQLKDDYEDIIFVKDSDEAGDNVVTGKNKDFPLTTAFGATLWVGEALQKTWSRPDGYEKTVKDTNDVAQYLRDSYGDDENELRLASRSAVEKIAGSAEPIALLAARYAGRLSGQLRQDALRRVIPLITMMPNDLRTDYAQQFALALYPDMSQTKAEITYQKWIRGELKKAQAETGEGDDEFLEVESLGGWYPESEDGNSGFLIDIFFDKHQRKIRFAYAHITDVEKNERIIVKEADFVIMGVKKIIPSQRPDVVDFLSTRALRLPSEVGNLLDSSELIKIRANFYQRFFYMEDKSQFGPMAAHSLFTWVYDAFDLLTFLSARGGSGSGKSDLMYLIGITSYRFAATSASSTDASYRGLASEYKATVMIDEVDEAIRKDDGSLAAHIKASFSKRISVHLKMTETLDANGRKRFAVSASDVYHPMLFTGYKPFKDAGIENRCMNFYLSQVDMITLDKNNIEPGYYPPEIEDEAEEIRNMSLHWRLATWLPKLELTQEQRDKYKLADPLVSPRINSTLRPMKVLAVLQDDMKLLEDLKKMGRANYEDEMTKRASSFEAVILRALLAADIARDVDEGVPPMASQSYAEKVKEYGVYVSRGNLGEHGSVRYVLYKNVADIANDIMDAENAGDDDKKKGGVKGRTIGSVARDSFRLPVTRTANGWAVILDKDGLDIAKLRFGLDREAEYQPSDPDEVPAETAEEGQDEMGWEF